jgi:hypothetical protein
MNSDIRELINGIIYYSLVCHATQANARAAESALVKITAERWLTSKEAAEVFIANNQGNQVLCISNELLGIHNDFVNCNES